MLWTYQSHEIRRVGSRRCCLPQTLTWSRTSCQQHRCPVLNRKIRQFIGTWSWIPLGSMVEREQTDGGWRSGDINLASSFCLLITSWVYREIFNASIWDVNNVRYIQWLLKVHWHGNSNVEGRWKACVGCENIWLPNILPTGECERFKLRFNIGNNASIFHCNSIQTPLRLDFLFAPSMPLDPSWDLSIPYWDLVTIESQPSWWINSSQSRFSTAFTHLT